MILVAAPKGWVAPQKSKTGIQPAETPVDADTADTEFSDIENILKQNQGGSPKPRQRKVQGKSQGKTPRPKQQTGPAVKQSLKIPTAQNSSGSAPVLPNQDWIAGATQRKRRNLLLGIGAVGLLALISVAVLLLTANRTGDGSQVVENVDPNGLTSSTDDAGSNVDVAETPQQPEQETNEPKAEEQLASDSPETVESTEPEATQAADGTPTEDAAEPEGVTEQPDDVADPADGNETPAATKSTPSPFSKGLDDILDQSNLQSPVSSDSLSDLLEDSGSSITELNQEVSALTNRRNIGLPKYYIKKPSPLEERTLQKLDDPIGNIEYNNQSLLTIIAELSQITGVPISFDCDQLSSIEFDFGAKVESFRLEDADFRTALEQVLMGLDSRLGVLYDGNSPATIVVSDFDNIDADTFDLPSSPSRTSEQFGDLIRQLIEPATWSNEECSIDVADQKIAISNSLFVRQRIEEFIDKWTSIASARTTGSWPDSIMSKKKAFTATRDLPNNFKHKYNLPCSVYLAKVQRAANVNIVIDFNTMLTLGWNQNTQVPSDIDESTVGGLVDELAHSLNVASRIVDQNTIELTSQAALAAKTDLEFYDCSKILAGQITPENLTALVRETLQNSSSNNLRIYLDEEIQSLIVIGAQPIQQQIEALLERLVELDSN